MVGIGKRYHLYVVCSVERVRWWALGRDTINMIYVLSRG